MVNIKIVGYPDFPCPEGWTADDAINGIRSMFGLIYGGILRNGLAVLPTSEIQERDDKGSRVSYEFVGFQRLSKSLLTRQFDSDDNFHSIVASKLSEAHQHLVADLPCGKNCVSFTTWK